MTALKIALATALLTTAGAAAAQTANDAQCILVSNAYAGQAKDANAKKVAAEGDALVAGNICNTNVFKAGDADAAGAKFIVIVNHFKSKGSCPTTRGIDSDQGDGQGCWNAKRVRQAQELLYRLKELRRQQR